MGEIDRKPIESVQAALSLFGEKSETKKIRITSSDESDTEKDFELESLLKDLANYKVQLEVNESAYQQALLDLNHYQKTAVELSTKLKNSESENELYREDRNLMLELESKITDMSVQLSDTKLDAFTRQELMETELQMEKKRNEELLMHIQDLNETIWQLRMSSASEAEGERTQTQATKEANSNAISELNKLKSDFELQERKYFDQLAYIELLETELNQIRKGKSIDIDRESSGCVMISKEEYEALVAKANESGQVREAVTDSGPKNQEMEDLKRELEAAKERIREFRSRAEQAASRAELAELAREGLEEQIRRWRGRKEKRKTALAALREESCPQESGSYTSYEPPPKTYVPLAKVLNMKF